MKSYGTELNKYLTELNKPKNERKNPSHSYTENKNPFENLLCLAFLSSIYAIRRFDKQEQKMDG